MILANIAMSIGVMRVIAAYIISYIIYIKAGDILSPKNKAILGYQLTTLYYLPSSKIKLYFILTPIIYSEKVALNLTELVFF